MARMYSRKKGRAGSTKPSILKRPIWERYDPKEVELIVQKLAKSGKTSSEIGIILRDTYGIPSVKPIVNKRIMTILKDNMLAPKIPEPLISLIKKDIKIMKHLEQNRKDQPAKRGMTITESKINKLVKYYKRKGALSQDWKYEKENAKLLIE